MLASWARARSASAMAPDQWPASLQHHRFSWSARAASGHLLGLADDAGINQLLMIDGSEEVSVYLLGSLGRV